MALTAKIVAPSATREMYGTYERHTFSSSCDVKREAVSLTEGPVMQEDTALRRRTPRKHLY